MLESREGQKGIALTSSRLGKTEEMFIDGGTVFKITKIPVMAEIFMDFYAHS